MSTIKNIRKALATVNNSTARGLVSYMNGHLAISLAARAEKSAQVAWDADHAWETVRKAALGKNATEQAKEERDFLRDLRKLTFDGYRADFNAVAKVARADCRDAVNSILGASKQSEKRVALRTAYNAYVGAVESGFDTAKVGVFNRTLGRWLVSKKCGLGLETSEGTVNQIVKRMTPAFGVKTASKTDYLKINITGTAALTEAQFSTRLIAALAILADCGTLNPENGLPEERVEACMDIYGLYDENFPCDADHDHVEFDWSARSLDF